MQGRAGRGRRRGLTLVEGLVAFALFCIVSVMLWDLFRFLSGYRRKTSLVALTDRTLTQKQVRVGLKQLIHRLREGTKIVSPQPGTTGKELVFRDLLNEKVRLRLDPATGRLLSERATADGYAPEAGPTFVPGDGGKPLAVAFPIRIDNCSGVSFTTVSPSCAVVSLTLFYGQAEASYLTAVHLRNHYLASLIDKRE